jgi:hypothetical protein
MVCAIGAEQAGHTQQQKRTWQMELVVVKLEKAMLQAAEEMAERLGMEMSDYLTRCVNRQIFSDEKGIDEMELIFNEEDS